MIDLLIARGDAVALFEDVPYEAPAVASRIAEFEPGLRWIDAVALAKRFLFETPFDRMELTTETGLHLAAAG